MPNLHQLVRLFPALLLGLLLSGCAALRPEPPEIQLAGLTISDLSLSHANFLATLSVFNPNRTELEVEAVEFALYLDEVRVARGKTARAFTIPAEQTGQTSLRLSTSFIDLVRLAQKLKGLDAVPFRIAGEVRIGGPGLLWLTVPVTSKGTLPLAGSLEQLLTTPADAWRQPERLIPGAGATSPPDPGQGAGERAPR